MSEHSLIAGERPFSSEQRETLRLIASDMIPASPEFDVPGADDPRIFAEILRTAGIAGTVEAVAACLQTAEEMAGKQGGRRFPDLDVADRAEVFERFRGLPAVFVLVSVILQCYYRDDRVMRSLGMEARPPFPDGYEVEPGDWSLLDPVRRRAPFYRQPG